MRTMTLPTVTLLALALASCSSYFDGTNLYFDFSQLPILVSALPTDKDCSKLADRPTCCGLTAGDPGTEACAYQADAAPPIGHTGCSWGPDPSKYLCLGTLTSGGPCSDFTNQADCTATGNNGCTWGLNPDPAAFLCSGAEDVGLCADDAYIQADPTQASPFEYDAWAMINGGPVRLARFTVRECAFTLNDPDVKKAITTVNFKRDSTFGYPDKASGSSIYGAVDDVMGGVPVGNAYMTTDVRLEGATEIFVTRETTADVDANPNAGPSVDSVVTKGSVSRNGDVLTGTFVKLPGQKVTGYFTAILVNRAPAW